MKITGGKHKGRNIEAIAEQTLRPTTARIREMIFNILKHGRFLNSPDYIDVGLDDLIANNNVIDIFCGTGALGLEALSRGASHVTFVDQNPKTLSLTKENISRLKEDNQTSLIRCDSTKLPKAPKPCMLAFIDPPYNQNYGAKALISLSESGWLEHGAIIILEHGKREDLAPPEGFILLDERIKDKTKLSILQYNASKNRP